MSTDVPQPPGSHVNTQADTVFLFGPCDERVHWWVTAAAVWSCPVPALVHSAFTMSDITGSCDACSTLTDWHGLEVEIRMYVDRKCLICSALMAKNCLEANISGVIHPGQSCLCIYSYPDNRRNLKKEALFTTDPTWWRHATGKEFHGFPLAVICDFTRGYLKEGKLFSNFPHIREAEARGILGVSSMQRQKIFFTLPSVCELDVTTGKHYIRL